VGCHDACMPIGLSPPCALAQPVWPILTSLHSLALPWQVVPTEPSGAALCRVGSNNKGLRSAQAVHTQCKVSLQDTQTNLHHFQELY
jgi:hypothetical protein